MARPNPEKIERDEREGGEFRLEKNRATRGGVYDDCKHNDRVQRSNTVTKKQKVRMTKPKYNNLHRLAVLMRPFDLMLQTFVDTSISYKITKQSSLGSEQL